MNRNADWLPRRRDDILSMAWNWMVVFRGGKAVAWGISTAEVLAFEKLIQAADDKLGNSKTCERTPGMTAECKVAFDALEAAMRDMKKRYFLKPPLEDVDFVNLGLELHDDVKTPVPVPVDHPGIEVTKWALHQLNVHHFMTTDNGGARSNHGIRIYYALVSSGDLAPAKNPSATRLTDDIFQLSAPPLSPKDLSNSFFTCRKNDIIEFPPEVSGYTCYLAARFENSKGESGPWSAMIHTVIP